MARPEFENQTTISAMTNKTITIIEGSSTDSIPAGGVERVTIYSPPNTFSRLSNCRLKWDNAGEAAATSGKKEFIVDRQKSNVSGIGMFKFVSSTFNKFIMYDQGYFVEGVSGVNPSVMPSSQYFPSSLDSISNQIQAVYFDDKLGMQLVFLNGYNVAISSIRDWVLFFEQEVVAR